MDDTDRSTLSSLHPEYSDDLNIHKVKYAHKLQGSHLFMLRRPQKNLESSRKYVTGDPTSVVDWKAYARTEELIVREARDEASSDVCIVVDASSSMIWPVKSDIDVIKIKVASKVEIAVRIGLHLAYLHYRKSDVVRVIVQISPSQRRCFYPRSLSDISILFDRLALSNFQNIFDDISMEELEDSIFDKVNYDLCYYIGDAIYNVDYTRYVESARNFIFWHVLSSLELDPSWLNNNSFYFDKSDFYKEYQGRFLLGHDAYLEELNLWRTQLEKDICRVKNGKYYVLSDLTSIDDFHFNLKRAVSDE